MFNTTNKTLLKNEKKLLLQTAFLLFILTGLSLSGFAQTTTYNSPGVYTFTVGAGVTSIGIDMQGATGGSSSCSSTGGKGGHIVCDLAVYPGEVLTIYVGGKGGDAFGCCSIPSGGFNGGGGGSFYGGGGGGASDIRISGGSVYDRILVAAGGGGANCNCGDNGADAGGSRGDDGVSCGSYWAGGCGAGGTEYYGGAGAYYGAASGDFGYGGDAYCCYYAGGGGSGWYGGGGGYYGSGGGGSSYPNSDGGDISNLVNDRGYNSAGDGSVTIYGPTLNVTPLALSFGAVTVGATSGTMSFGVSGSFLIGSSIAVTPPTDFEISTNPTSGFSTSPITMSISGGSVSGTIYVRFKPTTYSFYSSNITLVGGTPTAVNVLVTGTGALPCSGTPSSGTASVAPASGSISTPFVLSLSGTTGGGGLTYQWQSSAFSTFGFTDITGATTSTYTQLGISGNTYFRCIVSCPSGGSVISNNTFAALGVVPAACATPSCNYPAGVCSNQWYVGSSSSPFMLSGAYGTSITDNSACPSSAYIDQSATLGCTLLMGSMYTATLGSNTSCQTDQIWIDFNGDGNFSSLESVGGTAYFSGSPVSQSIMIPGTGITPGVYRMRVIVAYNGCCGGGCTGFYPNYPAVPSCPSASNIYSCDTRDYFVRIQNPACSGTPVLDPGADTITIDQAVGCAPYTANMYFNNTIPFSGFTYQWQSSNDNSTWTNIAGATNNFYSASVAATKWYRTRVSCGSSNAFSDSKQVILNAPPTPIVGSTNLCTATPVTYTSTPAGGTWSSANTVIATAGAGTGIITGMSPGITNITYTAPTGCTRTTSVVVNVAPQPITGSNNVCPGTTTALADVTTGGVWSSANSALATVGSASGIVTGVTVGTVNISYTVPNGCSSYLPVTVNALPAPIVGSPGVCLGGTTLYTNASPSGTWSSSNSFEASVVPSTGLVSGVSLGTPNITYTIPTGCYTTQSVTVNPVPAPITGPSSVCVGSSVTLTGSGTWSSSLPGIATVNTTTGVVTGVSAGSFVITCFAPTGCYTTKSMMVELLPAINNVTGGGGYCSGGSGVHIGIDGSAVGVDYQLYESGIAVGSPLSGSTSGLDFGLITATGIYTVVATNTTTGCSSNMNGSATVSINTPPVIYNVTGGGVYCTGGIGVHVGLSNSDLGVKYQLLLSGSPVGVPVNGVGGPLDFGAQTGSGAYTATAVDAATLCTSNMAGTQFVSTSPLPVQYTVTGGGPYCAGDSGVHVNLSNSDGGVEYQLYRNGVAVGSPLPGISGALDMGLQTLPGLYTIVAANIANGCTDNMSGSTTIVINPLPTVYTVTGGGNYCTGGLGVHVGLNFSVIGINYQLYNAGVAVGAAVAGANSGLDFGAITAAGTYTVVATSTATGCPSNMAGSATISVNPLPTLYSVTGGGPYCITYPGSPVGTDGSDVGTSYQLYRGLTPVGTALAGNSLPLDFGPQTIPGVYTVRAVTTATGCSQYMTGSATVTVNTLPAVYSVSGGGSYCVGGSGVSVLLSNSTPGIEYQPYVAGSPVGFAASGTGSMLDLGLQTVTGVYTIIATDPSTLCTSTMSGTATVLTNPLPAAYNVTGGGTYCLGGVGHHIRLALSNTGVNYELMVDGLPAGITLSGTGSALDFGFRTTAGVYTVVATNLSTGCVNNMTASATIAINPLPTVYTVMGGGSFCAGDTGVHVTLSGSATGFNYQLYNGSTPVGAPLPGTGASLDFGLQTVAGTYTVIATDILAGCSGIMTSSALVTVKPAPVVYTVSGGGNYCAGGVGMHVLLSGSDLGGVTYQLYNGLTPEGTPWAGTGLPLDLGAHTGAGDYKVVATHMTSGCTSNMNDSATIVVDAVVVPAVDITTTGGTFTVCAVSTTTFSALPVNEGTAPVYNWKVNGMPVGGFGSSYIYTPADNDVITVTLTSNAHCASPLTAVATHTITVTPAGLPTVSITPTPGNVLCPGSSVSFAAAKTFEGTSPVYSWKKNGVEIGTGTTLSYTPGDGDIIFLVMTSNYDCRLSDIAFSNNVTIVLDSPALPVVDITANPGTTVAQGTTVTFTAESANAGTGATYQWKVNGDLVAATSPVFTTNALFNGDVVGCVVSSHNSCGSRSTYQTVNLRVFDNVGVKNVNKISDVSLVPNPNKGVFTIKGNLATATDENVTIEVTNMLGQVVYTTKVDVKGGKINERIQLGNTLANGMYILNLHSAAENTVFHFVLEQ